MRALLIEDSDDIAECIIESLSQMDIASDWFREGRFVKSACHQVDYDVVILDLNLPDGDGLKALKGFRDTGGEAPVLIISARISVADRVAGLDLGADDYLVKPFALNEFEARIRALLRREFASGTTSVEFGDLSFDTLTREFSVHGEALELSGRERSVLEVLVKKNGNVASKRLIASHIYNFDSEASTSSIEIYVHRLRKKLASSGIRISTKRGMGYALELDIGN